MAAVNNNFFPRTLASEHNSYFMVGLRTTPVIGVFISCIQNLGNAKMPLEKYASRKIEYAKCERLGGILLIIAGIAILSMLPQLGSKFPNIGMNNFAYIGGGLVGLGVLHAGYFHHQIKQDKMRIEEWKKMHGHLDDAFQSPLSPTDRDDDHYRV